MSDREEDELRRAQEFVRAEQTRARRIAQIERDQLGQVRRVLKRQQQRKAARAARKRQR